MAQAVGYLAEGQLNPEQKALYTAALRSEGKARTKILNELADKLAPSIMAMDAWKARPFPQANDVVNLRISNLPANKGRLYIHPGKRKGVAQLTLPT